MRAAVLIGVLSLVLASRGEAQILQRVGPGMAEHDRCMASCLPVCSQAPTLYVSCFPCTQTTIDELHACNSKLQGLQQERDKATAALQSCLQADAAQKACVTKTAKVTAQRCFP